MSFENGDRHLGSRKNSHNGKTNYTREHFLATFFRDEPLGLVLSEVDVVDEDERYEHEEQWKNAIVSAKPGDVFVRDIVPGGQADTMGIFEIGDHLAGVGDFPHSGGFGSFVGMLQAIPER